jgi:hypothetical protein
MSYSFNVRARTKAEAIEKVRTELDKVVAQQPIHTEDADQALAAATAFINLLEEDLSQDVSVSVNGSLSWETGDRIVGANCNVSAHRALRTT